MKNKKTLNNFRKIQKYLPQDKFSYLKKELLKVPDNQLEAFGNIITAGYNVNFAVMNYLNLYEYVSHNSVDYSSALKIIYSIYPGLNIGIHINEPEFFELN